MNGTSHYTLYGVNEGRGICPASGTTVSQSNSRAYISGNRFSNWQKNGNNLLMGYSSQGELISPYMGTATYDNAGRRRAESSSNMYFDYNHMNERTARLGGNIDRQYAYDESSHLIGEYDGNGNMVVEYVWLGDRPIAAVYPGNVIVYIVTDHQNKPRRGINASTQQVVWSWDPDAFGAIQPTGSVTINLRFPGQYYDQQSGLYYNHNRYYNPELGRYMEPDPTGLEAGLNPYSYVSNNPVNSVDPTGLMQVMSDSQLRGVSGDSGGSNFGGSVNYGGGGVGGNHITIGGRDMGGSLNITGTANNFINQSNTSNMLAMGFNPAKNTAQPASTDIMMKWYQNMKTDNTIGNDKYFHCMAHCEASSTGIGGVATSEVVGIGREVTDSFRPSKWNTAINKTGSVGGAYDYMMQDSKSDLDANRTGQNGASQGNSCYSVCSIYVVPGINPRYLRK